MHTHRTPDIALWDQYRALREQWTHEDMLINHRVSWLILSEGLRFTDLNSKLERLAVLIAGVLQDLAVERGVPIRLSPRQAVTALSVFFLGSLDTIRLSRLAGLPLHESDVLAFIRLMIENAYRMESGELDSLLP